MTALRKDASGPLGKAIADTFAKELEKSGTKSGENFGKNLTDGIIKQTNRGAFRKELGKSIDDAISAIGDSSPGVTKRLSTLRKELDDGGKSANSVKRELDRLGESLFKVGQNDGNVEIARNAEKAAAAILGQSEVTRRYANERTSTDREIASSAREAAKAADGHADSEKRRGRAVRDGSQDNNVASRSLFNLRDALTGSSGSSNEGANAFRFFNAAVLAAVAVGPALVPVLAAIGGGLALLGPLLLGVGAGIGVAILGFSGLTGAVKALSDQQDATSASSVAYERQVVAAARAVADAQRGLADAHRRAADGISNALDTQRDAEERLVSAQRDAKQAQVDLTQARKEARQEQEELNRSLAQSQLDERQGVIDLFNAYNQYAAVQADGGSTNLEREQSDINLKQAQLNLEKIRADQKKLKDEKAKGDAQGIEGSDKVKGAEDSLTRALERQRDARQALGKATKAVDRARADGARSVADAQRSLTRAQEDYNFALQGGAEQIDKVNQAMDKLSPAGQRFARFIFGLKDGFKSIRATAQEGLLPGVESGLKRILNNGSGFRKFVGGLASDMGDLADKAGKLFTGRIFTNFFKAFAPAARQFTRDFGETVLSVFSGLASIFEVMLPFARDFSTFIADSADSFARWADSKKGQDQIRSFFQYVADTAPHVLDFFKAFLGFAVHLVQALAPVGKSILSFLTDGLERLNRVDPKTLQLIAVGIGSIILALQASQGLVALVSVLGAILASPVLIAIVAVGALAASFLYLSRSGGKTQKQFEIFVEKMQPLIDIFKDLAGLIKGNLVEIFQNDLMPALKDIWTSLNKDFIPAFERFWPVLRPLVKFLLFIGKEVLGGIILGIRLFVVGALKFLSGLMDFLTGIFTGNWSLIWKGLGEIVSGAWRLIVGAILLGLGSVGKLFKLAFKGIGELLGRFFEKVIPGVFRRGFKGLVYIIKNPLKIMKSAFSLWKDDVLSILGKLVKKVPELLGKIGSFFGKKLGNAVIDVTDFVVNKALIGGVNKIGHFLHLGGDDGLIPPIKLPDKFARGGVAGIIPGNTPGRDNHIIGVGGGEAIMRPEFTRAVGPNVIRAWNDAAIRGGAGAVQKLMGFAKGGVVWPTTNKHWTTYKDHDGMDFNGHPGNGYGDPYFATHDGKIAYTGAGRGYGNKVELKTTGGPTVIYGHSSKILVRAGDKVAKGQHIGNIGFSGHVHPAGIAGSHLHFGLLGEPKDEGLAAAKYLAGGLLSSASFGNQLSKLAGLGKGAVNILKDPAEFFKKRVKSSLVKLGPIGGLKDIATGVPGHLLGDLVDWAKKKTMSGLGMAKDFFVGASKVPGHLLSKVNPFGGRGPGLYDNGGYLPPGLSMVMNKTRTPEPVLTGSQWKLLADGRASGGQTNNWNLHAEGADPRKVVDEFAAKISRQQRMARRSGTLSRNGKR